MSRNRYRVRTTRGYVRRDINAKGIRRYADGTRAQQGGVIARRPSCPNCERLMQLVVDLAGRRTWVCRHAPHCNGTREVNTGR